MRPKRVGIVLAGVKDAGRRHAEVRRKANREACRAVRMTEQALQEALNGATLLGMPNLLPHNDGVFKARRILSGGRFGASEFLPRDGRKVLVLSVHGRLCWAWQAEEPGGHPPVQAVAPPVDDLDIVADWLEPFVRCVQEAVEMHTVKMAEREEAYRRIVGFSEKLIQAVGIKFR